jgi:hypothetical protein
MISKLNFEHLSIRDVNHLTSTTTPNKVRRVRQGQHRPRKTSVNYDVVSNELGEVFLGHSHLFQADAGPMRLIWLRRHLPGTRKAERETQCRVDCKLPAQVAQWRRNTPELPNCKHDLNYPLGQKLVQTLILISDHYNYFIKYIYV